MGCAYCLVIVSSRLRIADATVVHAASSATSSRASRADSPTATNFAAARRSLRKASSRPCSRSFRTPASLPLGLRAVARRKAYAMRADSSDPPSSSARCASAPRRFDVGRIVHQRQRLQRRVGEGAPRRALFAVGRVEGRQRRRRDRSLPERVHAPAIEIRPVALHVGLRREALAERHLFPEAGRLVGQHARSADLVVEQTARRQRGVADQFRGQALTRTARQQPVVGIALAQCRGGRRGLAIGRRRHDQALHRPHVPPGADELGRQPVEQLGMLGRLALHAEVFLGLDDAVAEIGLPEAIDGDARGERMLRHRPASGRASAG